MLRFRLYCAFGVNFYWFDVLFCWIDYFGLYFGGCRFGLLGFDFFRLDFIVLVY